MGRWVDGGSANPPGVPRRTEERRGVSEYIGIKERIRERNETGEDTVKSRERIIRVGLSEKRRNAVSRSLSLGAGAGGG